MLECDLHLLKLWPWLSFHNNNRRFHINSHLWFCPLIDRIKMELALWEMVKSLGHQEAAELFFFFFFSNNEWRWEISGLRRETPTMFSKDSKNLPSWAPPLKSQRIWSQPGIRLYLHPSSSCVFLILKLSSIPFLFHCLRQCKTGSYFFMPLFASHNCIISS